MRLYNILNLEVAILIAAVSSDQIPPYIEAKKDEMSPTLYARIEDKNKEYNPHTLEDVLKDARRWTRSKWIQQYGSADNRAQACVIIQLSYKNAITHMKQYSHIRATYSENVEYEIGYLTHEIIFRYQILLELYQMIERRFLVHPKRNVAPTALMLYFYSNIVEESRAIIHLCNMLHETELKYRKRNLKRKQKNAFADYFDPTATTSLKGSNVVLSKEKQYEIFMKMKAREAKQKQRQLAKQRKQMEKFGISTRSMIYVTKKSMFPLHYGWSIENWY